MIGVLTVIHVIACLLLIIMILIQAGRGGGLVENLSGVESMFGPKTSSFLTKATSFFSTLFFLTCISLAILSARQNRSLMSDLSKQKTAQTMPKQEPLTVKVGAEESAPKEELPKNEPASAQSVPIAPK